MSNSECRNVALRSTHTVEMLLQGCARATGAALANARSVFSRLARATLHVLPHVSTPCSVSDKRFFNMAADYAIGIVERQGRVSGGETLSPSD